MTLEGIGYALFGIGLLLAAGVVLYAHLSVQLEMLQSWASDRRAESKSSESDEQGMSVLALTPMDW